MIDEKLSRESVKNSQENLSQDQSDPEEDDEDSSKSGNKHDDGDNMLNQLVSGSKSKKSLQADTITFGEDQDGEVYFTTQLRGGEIFKFKKN